MYPDFTKIRMPVNLSAVQVSQVASQIAEGHPHVLLLEAAAFTHSATWILPKALRSCSEGGPDRNEH